MIEFFPIGDDALKVELPIARPPSRVYQAWADPEEFVQWFRGSEDGHLVIHHFDFREGGGFEVTMVSSSGHEATLTGTYLAIRPNSELRFSWQWKTPDGFGPSMVVTIDFVETPTGTLLSILHQPFISLDDRDAHRSGWEPCLSNLIRFLGTT